MAVGTDPEPSSFFHEFLHRENPVPEIGLGGGTKPDGHFGLSQGSSFLGIQMGRVDQTPV